MNGIGNLSNHPNKEQNTAQGHQYFNLQWQKKNIRNMIKAKLSYIYPLLLKKTCKIRVIKTFEWKKIPNYCMNLLLSLLDSRLIYMQVYLKYKRQYIATKNINEILYFCDTNNKLIAIFAIIKMFRNCSK